MNRATSKATTDSWQTSGYVVSVYSLLAVFSLALFGSLHVLYEPRHGVGYLELLGSAAFLLNVLVLQVTTRVRLAENCFLFLVTLFLGLMLVSGGTANSGIFWVFVFPVSAFFLTGIRGGMWWMAALLVTQAAIWVASKMGVVTLPYNDITLRQLGISLIVVTIGIYAYQKARDQLKSQTRESRAELQAEKLRAEVIVQNIAEGIITTDAAGRVTFMNETAQKLLGWTAQELAGKSFIKMVPMIDGAGHEVSTENRPLQRSLDRGESQTTDAAYRRKDGSTIKVSVTGTPLRVNGKVLGSIGTFRDISEEQDVVRAKSEFVTLASHQLRTPLAAISWVSELLLNGDAGALSPEQRDHIADIYRSNQRMSALVGEMLMVSSLDLHALPVIPQKTNIKSLVATIVKEQLVVHSGQHPAVEEIYDPHLPEWQCDPEILRNILRNLVSNAIKYTPKNGHVTVRVIASHRKLFPDSKGSLEYIVTDTGYGIPRDVQNKIFGKFFRAKNITHRDTDGTGLGLYIVKSLLDYVGGRIAFHSDENKGTTFTVSLPREGMTAYRPQQADDPVPHAEKPHA